MPNDRNSDLVNSLFLADLFFTTLTFGVAYVMRDLLTFHDAPLHFNSHLFIIPLLLLFITISLSYFGGYNSPIYTKIATYIWSITRAIFVSVSALLTILFFFEIEYVSRLIILLFAFLELFTLLTIRIFSIRNVRKSGNVGKNKKRVLIVGSKTRAKDLIRSIEDELGWGVVVIGCVDPDPTLIGNNILSVPIIGTVSNIEECLKNNIIDEVIVAISRSLLKDAEPIVQACENEGISLKFMADLFNVQVARISLSKIKHIPLLNLETIAQDRQQLIIKRVFDVVFTTISIPILLPLFVIVAILIKLDSRGPVFFIQERIGLRKHPFRMYKFRTMHIDAEQRLKELEHLNEADGPIFKMKKDPRITKVGKFLRKTSIDELPQLINVLKNDMSLVGPRPMSKRDVNLFDKGIQRKRFSVQPGLTCLWQISGRSNLPFDKWLELDLEYIEKWSFLFDMEILLKTLPAVLGSKGAQ